MNISSFEALTMNNLGSEVHKNVEIKARIRDYENIISKVQTLCLSHGEIIEQEDTFFNVPNGRLKLRRRTVSESNIVVEIGRNTQHITCLTIS